ncbi:MAG: hypothetical protein ACE3L7_24500 [Candidatus Pristimantibacillus sp.]
MKLSGFLFGGAVGMVAALYVARKRPGTAAMASSAISSACATMGKKAMSMMMNGKWQAQAATSVPKHSNGTAKSSKGDWSQIEGIINSDPELREQTNQILAESSSRTH